MSQVRIRSYGKRTLLASAVAVPVLLVRASDIGATQYSTYGDSNGGYYCDEPACKNAGCCTPQDIDLIL